ncbi:SulP family inorganic anion transporter [Nitrospira sp. NS4]|uniref:SulP family inorganic anion transporter n=1 Tax=Nitrospira sp. NS4 TaxID=3414498 RepID=UPI003C307FC8
MENNRNALIGRFAPGLRQLLDYRREWLHVDLVAGLSVAAVAIPTAIAYAQLIGFEPVVGLYAAILPLVAYALFGTSRQLIVNPDAATCAIFAATVLPLAGGDSGTLRSLSMALAVLTGLVCIAAGVFRLGFLADFLAKPILVGYLNGVAISIFVGQVGKVVGFAMQSRGIIQMLIELAGKLHQTHLPTLAVGLTTLAVIMGSKRWSPRAPAPLLATVAAVALVYGLGLEDRGVAVVGELPAGLPSLSWPRFDADSLKLLLGGALSVALVSFSSGMVTARSFAERNRYDIDADQEFIALGACQIASGLSEGFAVTGADSRTAVNDAMGGKTQMVGLIAAATMAAALFFLTGPLRYLPVAALGAVLIYAAVGLFDVAALRKMWRVNRAECVLSLFTTVGVIWLDLLQGILLAVGSALLLVLTRASRPPDAVLAHVPGMRGWHDVADHPKAATHPGLLVYRFRSGIMFFNAGYFKKRVLELVASQAGIEWVIVDGSTINLVDITGAETLESLAGELAARGLRFGLANVRRDVRTVLENAGALERIGSDSIFPTLNTASEAFLHRVRRS